MEIKQTSVIEENFFYESSKMMKIQTKADELSFDLGETLESVFEKVFSFSVDDKNRIRLSSGMVAYDEKSEEDLNYVPNLKYGPEGYSIINQDFTLSLPNPSTHGMEKYIEVRSICLSEIQKRMKKALIEANALVDDFIKNENEENLDTKASQKFRPR